MTIEIQMQYIRLTMLVMLLIQDEEHHNLSKKDKKRYKKYYLKLTGETWEETRHLYLEDKCQKQPDKS